MNRIASLDGLRGLAAFAVVLSHVAALAWIPWVSERAAWPWEWGLWHLGAPAVDLFFVLSGFVVAGSARTRPLGGFLTRRAVRLMPVAFVGVLLGLLVIRPLGGALDTPLRAPLSAPLPLGDVLAALTFLIPYDTNRLNPPLWTLVVELQATLLMPLFARLRSALWLPLIAGLGWLLTASGLLFPLFAYAELFALFALGALLTRVRVPARGLTALALAGLAVLLSRHAFGIETGWWHLISGVGAAMLIVGVLGGVGTRLLNARPAQWLGRISYPLYATHFAALFAGATLTPAAPALGGLLIGVPLALLLAHAVTAAVEAPLLRYLTAPNPAKVSLPT